MNLINAVDVIAKKVGAEISVVEKRLAGMDNKTNISLIKVAFLGDDNTVVNATGNIIKEEAGYAENSKLEIMYEKVMNRTEVEAVDSFVDMAESALMLREAITELTKREVGRIRADYSGIVVEIGEIKA